MTNEERARRFLAPILDGESCLVDDDNEEDVALVASLTSEFDNVCARILDEVGVTVAAVDGGVEALRAVAKLRTKWLGSAR
jgi:CheY-like chemotaxis protein